MPGRGSETHAAAAPQCPSRSRPPRRARGRRTGAYVLRARRHRCAGGRTTRRLHRRHRQQPGVRRRRPAIPDPGQRRASGGHGQVRGPARRSAAAARDAGVRPRRHRPADRRRRPGRPPAATAHARRRRVAPIRDRLGRGRASQRLVPDHLRRTVTHHARNRHRGGRIAQENPSPRRAVLLHESVFEYARSRPDAPAVVCGAERLSYRDLDQRANAVAHALQERGTRPGRLVGICAHRGIDGLVGLLGILKSGCAYVPLDPDYPRERLDFMVRDSEIDTVVVDAPQTARQLPTVGVIAVCDTPGRFEQPPEMPVSADDLCYVIYTSGSMGRPKGSMNAHGGVVNTLRGLVEVLPVADGFRIALISSLNYDMSVFEVFGTWLLGGCVVVPRPDEVNDPDRLITMLHEQQVQMWNSAPALFDLVLQRALATGRTLPDSLRVVALGGDRFPPGVIGLARAVAPMAQLFNLAGLTETSYCSTWYRVRPEDAEGAIPWGYPLPGQQLYVLDDRLSPVPDGELGEMCIGGPGVGRGYWRRPELTALRFVADPFGRSADARMFRTGDQVRRRADGCLEFHGRLDDQIKVRGLRIEPGEIERVVERHP